MATLLNMMICHGKYMYIFLELRSPTYFLQDHARDSFRVMVSMNVVWNQTWHMENYYHVAITFIHAFETRTSKKKTKLQPLRPSKADDDENLGYTVSLATITVVLLLSLSCRNTTFPR
jgi:hypothetical protein